MDHPFTKSNEIIQKFKETEDSRYIYQNKLDKDCFQEDMAYGDFQDSGKKTTSDKILQGKAFNVAKFSKCNRYQRSLASMVYRFFEKKKTVIRLNS